MLLIHVSHLSLLLGDMSQSEGDVEEAPGDELLKEDSTQGMETCEVNIFLVLHVVLATVLSESGLGLNC